jgi:hypothetical protein
VEWDISYVCDIGRLNFHIFLTAHGLDRLKFPFFTLLRLVILELMLKGRASRGLGRHCSGLTRYILVGAWHI